MNDELAVQCIANSLTDVLRSLKFEPDRARALSSKESILTHSKGDFLLNVDKYDALLRRLRSRYPVIAEHTIEKHVRKAIFQSLDEIVQVQDFGREEAFVLGSVWNNLVLQEKLLSVVEDLLRGLSATIRNYTVFVPLTGIELPMPAYDFGPVALFRMAESPPVVQKNDGTAEYQYVHSAIHEHFAKAPCVIQIQPIEGDTEFARQEGMRQANQLAAILNLHLAIWSLRAGSHYQKIRCADVSSPSVEIVLARTELPDDNDVIRSAYLSAVYNCGVMKLTPDKILFDDIKNKGFDFIWQCFEHSNRASQDELYKRVRRAVMWFDKSVKFDEIDAQFVGIATALEILLTSRGSLKNLSSTWGGITQQLADRCAYLLGHDLESTIEIAKRVKKLYGVRSKIVHGGGKPTAEELFDLVELASDAILNFVQRGFSSFEEFEMWVHHLRYSVNLDEIERFRTETN